MAKSKQKKAVDNETAELNEAPVKSKKKVFSIPKNVDFDKSTTVGEFPLRTYEMFRNKFVGIS